MIAARTIPAIFLGLCLLALPARAIDPVINEIMASNSNGLVDEDGDASDWLEIHNPDAAPVALDGWYLTDKVNQKTQWRFPAVTVPAGGYLVVFASNKNRAIAGAELHTNFALSAGGEYLALIKPDGLAVASAFAPFPAQTPDVAYGYPSMTDTITLLANTASSRWIVPTSSTTPGESWRQSGFNDNGWNLTAMGIGYDRNTSGTNYLPQIGSNGNTESAMYNIMATAYCRIPLTVPSATALRKLTLHAQYDDGFAAYLNGSPLLASGQQLTRNAPATIAWNSGTALDHADALSIVPEVIDISSAIPQLVNGQNTLAVQIFNKGTGSSDCLFRASITAEVDSTTTGGPGFFATATPGARNPGPSGLVIPQTVTFSRASGTFSSNFNLTLSGTISGQVIRYTTDGTIPTTASTTYSGPIPISATTWIRARVFESSTGASGPPGGCHYEMLDSTLTSYATTGSAFRSALPIVILNNKGGGEIADDDTYRDVRLHVIDRAGDGYAPITATPALSIPAAAKLRGSSSAGFPKKSYGIELRDEAGGEAARTLLGMPAGSDWALISCYDFDRCFMRNAWIFEAYRRAGRWAPRTRLVEVYFNQDGDNLEYADYRGVYLLCETIRSDPNRVDITRLETADISEPGISGGYIFKVDRPDADEFHWLTNRGQPLDATNNNELVIHRPKLTDLATAQASYLVEYFQQFEDALVTEAGSAFPTRNYRKFIDPVSWADYNIFHMLPKNVDALRLSAYFQKDRGRRMEGGALWDFDRSANSTDGRDNNTSDWLGTGDGTDYFGHAWWQYLFADIEFRQLYVDRWAVLRGSVFSNSSINGIIDGYTAEFKATDADNPASRDYAKWYGSPTANTLITEANNLKSWLTTRCAWIDSQFAGAPALSPGAGPIASGSSATISIPVGTSVYYTLDGSDPRAEGGGIRAGAILYGGGTIPLGATTTLTARAFRSGSFTTPATNWSAPAAATYLVNESYASEANLRVSGVHYHPLGPTNTERALLLSADDSSFEWIEVMNSSNAAINLDGVQLAAGSPVSAVTLPARTLAPGERALVAKNRQAIALRYGQSTANAVVAEWTGDKSIANAGDEIWILDRNATTIARFSFGDSDSPGWPDRADGPGSALEYFGTSQATSDYQSPQNWQSSTRVHGEPGQTPVAVPSGIVINEVMPQPAAGQLDAIELFNATGNVINLSGWFLSPATSPASAEDYQMYRIPDGTVLGPGGYIVFDETQFNPNGAWNPSPGTPADSEFELDGYRGGSLRLVSANPSNGGLIDFQDRAEWSPMLPGISAGRRPDGSGDLIPLSTPSLPGTNSVPRHGDVQVSEILYHPAGTTLEFLELTNATGSAIGLAGWTLRGDVDFDFDSGHILEAGEVALLVPYDPATQAVTDSQFRASHGVPAATRIWGPWTSAATLGDAGGDVRLRRTVPSPPDDPTFIGRMIEDEVAYSASAPWPTGASSTGASIQRIGIRSWGMDPTAWIAAATTAGSDAGGYHGWARARLPSTGNARLSTSDPDGDGLPNAVEYQLGTDPARLNSITSGIRPAQDTLPDRFQIDYTRRRDRTDWQLTAWHGDLQSAWSPASHDEFTEISGMIESRRAWIPLTPPRGMLRLQALPIP